MQKNKAQILQQKYSFSDWGISSGWNQIERENPEVNRFESRKSELKNWNLGLQKKIPYGLNFSSNYQNINESNVNSDLLKQFRPDQIF